MKVLRNVAMALMILLLLTSCEGNQNEQEKNENTNKQQSIQLQIDDPKVQKIVIEMLESKKWNLQNESIEEYTIISAHAGSMPATNVKGGTYQNRHYNFINFCYEVDDKIYFKTISTDNNGTYEIAICQMGMENKVTIVSGEMGFGETEVTIYCFTLTEEVYKNIYNS
ncbi:MAG: hypothetical protein HFJ28_05135 [Clostridia bacterium]|jgi:hypothetical protein|nr:hypothetical protein [Clostridia bacterium]